jgi:hypothetical protein
LIKVKKLKERVTEGDLLEECKTEKILQISRSKINTIDQKLNAEESAELAKKIQSQYRSIEEANSSSEESESSEEDEGIFINKPNTSTQKKFIEKLNNQNLIKKINL